MLNMPNRSQDQNKLSKDLWISMVYNETMTGGPTHKLKCHMSCLQKISLDVRSNFWISFWGVAGLWIVSFIKKKKVIELQAAMTEKWCYNLQQKPVQSAWDFAQKCKGNVYLRIHKESFNTERGLCLRNACQ